MIKYCEVCGLVLNNGKSYRVDDLIVCMKHSNQYKKHGKFLDNFPYYICDVCGRKLKGRGYFADGKRLCGKHLGQFTTYGKFLDTNPRTTNDPNEIHKKKNKAYVDLYDKDQNVCAQVIIDIEDVTLIEKYKWSMSQSNGLHYAVTNKGKKTLCMHRIIMGVKDKKIHVDHINHNTLDNRKMNLRITSHSKNMKNTNDKGVYHNKKNDRYYAQIMCDGIRVILKQYMTYDESKYSRWYAEKLLFREFQCDKSRPKNSLTSEQKKSIREDVKKTVRKKFPDLGL